jgi:tetratricopeptide (TPR) repeat protein
MLSYFAAAIICLQGFKESEGITGEVHVIRHCGKLL